MCGITGIIPFNEVGRFNMINLAAATEALESRGPDFQGHDHGDYYGLGHRRLSVIDTSSEAHQPMQDSDNRYSIVFNGEIYNYKALKEELQNAGVAFNTNSDTEVLLQLYIRYKEKCLEKLNGFFAFAIYDKTEKELFIARDRFGIKPLLYYIDSDKFIFASESKSIFAYGIQKELNHEALYTYFQLNYIPAPLTAISNIRKLMPGNYAILRNGNLQISSYYSIPFNTRYDNSVAYEDKIKTLQQLLEESVQKRLISDVPLGSFLSGGIDSSIIATLAARHQPGLNTFSVGFADEPYFDETKYANEVANKIGSNHTVFKLTNKDLLHHLEDVLAYTDDPFADSSALAVYILSKETSKHCTVALSGDGADELFSGYNKHSAFYRLMHRGVKENAAISNRWLWSLLPKSRHAPGGNLFRQLDKFAKGAKLNGKDRYWFWAGFGEEKEMEHMFTTQFLEGVDFPSYYQHKSHLLTRLSPNCQDFNEILHTDLNVVLTNDMLTKVDWMSMANSLEVRVPFLDHNLVQYVMQLPAEDKINANMKKRILQDAYQDILPQSLYNRSKKGFEVPLLKWFRQELKSRIEGEWLLEETIQEQGIFNLQYVQKLKKKLQSSNPGDSHAKVWALIVFQEWYKRYFS